MGSVQVIEYRALRRIGIAAGIVRMRADGGTEKIMLRHQREHLFLVRLLLAGIGHYVRAADAGLAHARDHLGAILVKGGIGDVAVRIKYPHGLPSRIRFSACA